MSERVEPITRRRGPVAPLGIPPLRDEDDQRDREQRRRRPRPPAPPAGAGGSGVTRDADGQVHVDVRA